MKKLTALSFFLLFTLPILAQDFSIGIVVDTDDQQRTNEIVEQFKVEIQRTLGSGVTVIIDPDNILSSHWDMDVARSLVEGLQGKVDAILTLGNVTTQAAAQITDFQTPTIGIGVLDAEFQALPLTESGTSGVHNFSYILNTIDIVNALEVYQNLAEFENITFLVERNTAQYLDVGQAALFIATLQNQFGINISVVQLGDDIQNSLEEIPEESDAVFLAITYERSDEEIGEVAAILKEKKLPSFGFVKEHVDVGILASSADENSLIQVLRKTAIMIDEVSAGAELADMNVYINRKESLFLNINTAQEIGFNMTFETLYVANIIDDQSQQFETFSLDQIIQKGLEQNLDIAISDEDVLLQDLAVQDARVNYLPSVSWSFSSTILSENQTNNQTGQAQQSLSSSGSLSQLIYSDQVLANIQIQKYLLRAEEFAQKQQVYDVMLDVYTAYFNVLSQQANLLIQQENLEESKRNLELSKIQVDLGYSNNQDLFRLEGEVANNTQGVISASLGLESTKDQLNQLLNYSLPIDFELEDVSEEDPIYLQYAEEGIMGQLNGIMDLEIIQEFLIEEAYVNYPSRNQLLENLNSLERQVSLNKRAYFIPTVSGFFNLNNTLLRTGAASDPAPGVEYIDNTWNAGVSVSIPLFDGNNRSIDIQSAMVQQNQADLQLELLDDQLQLVVTAQLRNLISAKTNIFYSRVAYENTEENFQIIQDQYSQGTVSITTLLDAQNSALSAKQSYTNSIYDFITAYLTLEYDIGFFSAISSPEEVEAFENRLIEFISQK